MTANGLRHQLRGKTTFRPTMQQEVIVYAQRITSTGADLDTFGTSMDSIINNSHAKLHMLSTERTTVH